MAVISRNRTVRTKRGHLILMIQLTALIVTVAATLFVITPGSATEHSSRSVVFAAATQLERAYVFPSRGREAAAFLRREVASSKYDGLRNRELATTVTADLKTVLHDEHVTLNYFPADNPASSGNGPSAEALTKFHQFEREHGYGVGKASYLPGNVGYLEMLSFADAPEAYPTIDAAATLMATTKAIVLDLRHAVGASPRGVARFVSHFIGPHVHLSDFLGRGDGNDAPVTESSYTVDVPRNAAPLYVLISHETFSGSEECAYDLQAFRRGELIGAVTAGGANKGFLRRLDDHFAIFIPTERARNAITGTNWEGVGVKPDVAVSPERALAVAYRKILSARLHDSTLESEERTRLTKLRSQLDTMSDAQILAGCNT